jgi:predicted enzyme related to lactoylglutathione lyase
MLQKVAFSMFTVSDAKRARAFYEDTLRLVRGMHSPDGAWTEYDLPGGGCLALWQDSKIKPGGGAAIAFEVDDLDQEIARLKAAGATFSAELIRGPRCRMANLTDPDGNAIILHQLNER